MVLTTKQKDRIRFPLLSHRIAMVTHNGDTKFINVKDTSTLLRVFLRYGIALERLAQ